NIRSRSNMSAGAVQAAKSVDAYPVVVIVDTDWNTPWRTESARPKRPSSSRIDANTPPAPRHSARYARSSSLRTKARFVRKRPRYHSPKFTPAAPITMIATHCAVALNASNDRGSGEKPPVAIAANVWHSAEYRPILGSRPTAPDSQNAATA